MSRTIYIAAAISVFSLSGSAVGASFSLGAIGSRTSSIYKDVSPKNGGAPFLSISGEHAYLKGNEVGYNLFPAEAPQNITFGVEYNNQGFDPDDSSDAAMKQLNKRKATGMAFMRAKYSIFFGKFATDIGDRHNGSYALVGAGYPIKVNAWLFTPTLTYQYIDKKMSTYLYGVSQEESLRTGGTFSEYTSTDTSKVTVGVHAKYAITPSLTLLLGAEHSNYKNVLDSPIVSKDYSYSASAGLLYTFK